MTIDQWRKEYEEANRLLIEAQAEWKKSDPGGSQ